jgi:hypothetical protein
MKLWILPSRNFHKVAPQSANICQTEYYALQTPTKCSLLSKYKQQIAVEMFDAYVRRAEKQSNGERERREYIITKLLTNIYAETKIMSPVISNKLQ